MALPGSRRTHEQAVATFVKAQTRRDADRLIAAVSAAIGQPDGRLDIRHRGSHVVVLVDDRTVGRITAYSVQVGGRPVTAVDVRADPPTALAAVAAAARRALAAGEQPKPARQRPPDDTPARTAPPLPRSGTSHHQDGAPFALTGNATTPEPDARRTFLAEWLAETPTAYTGAMAASELLRSRRRRDPAAAMQIDLALPKATLTFEPIGPARPLRVSFTFRHQTGEFRGELHLVGAFDPLPLRQRTLRAAGADGRDLLLAKAWAAALIVYADITCSQPVDGGGDTQAATARDIADTDSMVAGHLRRLRDGQTASEPQRAAAAQLDIVLPEHYTWVRSHTRGSGGPVLMHLRYSQRLW